MGVFLQVGLSGQARLCLVFSYIPKSKCKSLLRPDFLLVSVKSINFSGCPSFDPNSLEVISQVHDPKGVFVSCLAEHLDDGNPRCPT